MASSAKREAKKPAGSAHEARTDATALLHRDHADVLKLFKQYDRLAEDRADAGDRHELAAQICTMLTAHTAIEEEIFYPAARDAGVDSDLLDEAEVEHAAAKDLIAQIESMSAADELYDAKVKVLGEYVDHHVREEEGELFPRCRRAKMDLAALAQALAERKSLLMAQTTA